jgi:hypothetical protein
MTKMINETRPAKTINEDAERLIVKVQFPTAESIFLTRTSGDFTRSQESPQLRDWLK